MMCGKVRDYLLDICHNHYIVTRICVKTMHHFYDKINGKQSTRNSKVSYHFLKLRDFL